jgi:transcriptional regulator with XRE-family HTH domain
MSEDALREALGAAIRDRRKALGLTLNEMAKKTGRIAWLSVADRAGEELRLD